MGVPALGLAISTFFSPDDIPTDILQAYFFTTMITRIIPFLFIGGGLYLLGGGESIYKFAYPEQEENRSDFKEKFTLALKILGVYLVISYLPSLLENISEFITKASAPPMYQMMMSGQQFNITTSISNMIGFALGLYLLRSGKWFINYGLKRS
jgi:hypothetical protein